MLYRREDMPFTTGGLVPDIIMNPHAIPSRMTIGQLMESLESKVCASAGRPLGDGTPFNGRTVEDVSSELLRNGFERYGNEIVHNPRTGEMVECAMFITPCFYQVTFPRGPWLRQGPRQTSTTDGAPSTVAFRQPGTDEAMR